MTTEVFISSITASHWFPISSYYPEDEYIGLKPTLLKFKDGYTVFHHPLYEHTKDIAFQKDSSFALTSAMPFFTFATETTFAFAYLGAYVSFEKFGGFITSTITSSGLFLSAVPESERTLFRLLVNDDNSISFLHGDSLYVTVCELLPYDLFLAPQLGLVDLDRQKFNVYSPDNEQIYIVTKFDNIYYPSFPPEHIERFWSFSDNTSSIRAIGMVGDDDWGYDNPYLWKVNGYDVVYAVDGLTRDNTWVIYYNDILSKINNQNLEIDIAVSAVPLNRLVDNPYHTQLALEQFRSVTEQKTGSMAVNIANLKTVMTPEYEYDFIPAATVVEACTGGIGCMVIEGGPIPYVVGGTPSSSSSSSSSSTNPSSSSSSSSSQSGMGG